MTQWGTDSFILNKLALAIKHQKNETFDEIDEILLILQSILQHF